MTMNDTPFLNLPIGGPTLQPCAKAAVYQVLQMYNIKRGCRDPEEVLRGLRAVRAIVEATDRGTVHEWIHEWCGFSD